jgi:hypothetical protein
MWKLTLGYSNYIIEGIWFDDQPNSSNYWIPSLNHLGSGVGERACWAWNLEDELLLEFAAADQASSTINSLTHLLSLESWASSLISFNTW